MITAQRCQTLHLIKLHDVQISESDRIIKTSHLLKQSRPGHHLQDMQIQKYKDPNICLFNTLSEYISRTSCLKEKEQQLLITPQKPHKGVTRATVNRWVKLAMIKAGVDKTFTVHSTRSASTSKEVPLSTIVNTAGWAQARMFQKFYIKPITGSRNFQDAILE